MKCFKVKQCARQSTRLAICFLIILFSGFKAIGQTIHHIVEKGEDIQSIAKLYDTTCSKLAEMNNGIDVFYTGLAIEIPIPEDLSISELRKNEEQVLQYYAEYKQLKERYKSGAHTKEEGKNYRDLINKYKRVSSCSNAYYKLAETYYFRDKYNKAIENFNIALNGRGLTAKNRRLSHAYIEKIEEILRKRAEKNNRIWNNVCNGLAQGLQAGANTYMQYEQMKQSGTVSSGFNSFTGINSNLNGLDPTSEAYTTQALKNADASYNRAISQIQQNSNAFLNQSMINMQNEMQLAKQRDQQCHDMWVRNLGREPTAEEDQTWWTNYYTGMTNAYLQANSSTTVSSSSQNDVNNKPNNVVEKAKEYHKERYGYKQCHICNGYKKCKYCNGTKIRRNEMTGNNEPCGMCWLKNGVRTGLCSQCGGTGQTYGIKN